MSRQDRLFEVIKKDDQAGLDEMLAANPRVIFARSEDGRGPLFWAYEYGRGAMIKRASQHPLSVRFLSKASARTSSEPIYRLVIQSGMTLRPPPSPGILCFGESFGFDQISPSKILCVLKC